MKVGLIQALIASNLGVFGIAANWGWEAVNDYGSNLSIPIAWLPPEEYFAGDSIVGLVQASGAGMVIGDSLETLSRLTHLKLPTVLLLFDFYPQLWAQLGAVPAEIDRALQMLRSLDPRTTTVLTRCADDARRLGEVVSLRTVVFDGVDVSDVGGESVCKVDGPAVCLGNFHYRPNCAGLEQLVECWTADRRLRVVGSLPLGLARDLRGCDRVDIWGVVPSVAQALVGASCGLVPVQVGGGISTKTLEYSAWGLPVISTRIGVRGLDPALVACCVVVGGVPEVARAVNAFDPEGWGLDSKVARARSIILSRYSARSQVAAIVPALLRRR